MGSITDIEREMKGIIVRLEALSNEIKNANQSKITREKEYDFSKITRIAQQCPIYEHPLSKTDEHIKTLYLTFLSSVMQYRHEVSEDMLYYFS